MYSVTQKILASLVLIASSMAAVADDIDIINRDIPIKTNILFVMDLSGSMNTPTTSGPSRIDELGGAFRDIVADPAFKDINIGLSMFSGAAQGGIGSREAHGIAYPVSPVTGENPQNILNGNASFTHKGIISYLPSVSSAMTDNSVTPPEINTRKYLQALSKDSSIWSAGGSTPLVDALYEAALYFKGGEVKWGRHQANHISAAHPATYTGSIEELMITPACVSNPANPNYNRVSCSQGSCGVTEVCQNRTVRKWSPVDTGNNCTAEPNRCRASSLGGTCGFGTNCTDHLSSGFVHVCEDTHSTISSCINDHPTWEACQQKPKYTSTTDSEGNVTRTQTGTRIKCKEMRTYCDAPDDYRCDVVELSCTKCPGPQSQLTRATYKSPIKEKCPANGIVLLSDGEPTENKSARLISSLIGNYSNGCDAGSDDRRCGPELARYLASEDQNTDPLVPDAQTVSTYTVGLELPPGSLESEYLKQIAAAGNGSFVNANNRAELAIAFKEAILAVAKQERTFSSPSYTVNTATQLTHGKYVYVPMFDRGVSAAWPGNLKKYELKNGKLYGKNVAGTLVEATDASGRLKAEVRDLWLGSTMGGIVQSGGAAHKIPVPANRKIYTDAGISGSDVVLDSSHELDTGNGAITNALLGASSSANRQKYIKFIRGEKSDGTPRHHMGDIIHSKPLQLAYSSTDSVIFVGTNEGYLHALNANTGIELFAFMPSELLKNIKPQYNNTSVSNHLYGVDGAMKLWLDDTNKNGVKDAGEDAYLYFGLRRGGKSYYALKLSDNMAGAPTLKWRIKAGDSDFSSLGYTWSKPTLAKLRYEKNGTDTGKPEPVLVFGGGYVNDHNGESAQNTKGSEVFIVDAITGAHIWDTDAVPAPSVLYAVPAKIRTVDADRNGSIDRLYFGDTGGNLWRVDLGGTGADKYKLNQSKVTLLARLGDGSGTNGANDRKFFTEPDVAFLKHKGKYALSIAIGSGSRPNPLNMSVENQFFMILDKDVFKRPSTTPTVITASDLQDAPVPTTMDLVSKLHDATSKKGWKMRLSASGEKSLSTALTFQNKVLFTTLVIKEITAANYNNLECGLNNTNEGRLYALDLLTGGAVLDLDSKTPSDTDSFVVVTGGEILETPQIVYGNFVNDSGGACTTKECARKFSIHVGKGPAVGGSSTPTSKPIPVSKTLPRAYWLDKEK